MDSLENPRILVQGSVEAKVSIRGAHYSIPSDWMAAYRILDRRYWIQAIQDARNNQMPRGQDGPLKGAGGYRK